MSKRLQRLRLEIVQMDPYDNDHLADLLVEVIKEMEALDHRVAKQEKLMTKTVKKPLTLPIR